MSVLRYFITSKAKRNILKFFFSNGNAYYTRELARLTGEPLNAVRRELGYLEKAGLLHSYMQGNQKYYEIVESFPLLAEWKKIVLETDDTAIPARRPLKRTPAKGAAKLASVTGTAQPAIRKIDEGPILPEAQVIMKQAPPVEPGEVTATPGELEETVPPVEEEKQYEAQPAFTIHSMVNHLKDRFSNISSVALAIVHGDAAKSEEIPADGVDLLVVGDISKDSLIRIIAEIEESTGVGINLVQMTRSDFDYRNAQSDPLVRRIWSEKKMVVKGRH